MLKHIKDDTYKFLGVTFSAEYLQRVQLPMLVEQMHWSPSMLVSLCEREGLPLGQFARSPTVQRYLIEQEELREQAEKERLEAERLAAYNSPEARAERQRNAEALHQARIKQGMEIRSGRSMRPRGNDVDYAPTAMFDD